MVRIIIFLAMTVGGYLGWWLGEQVGIFTAFFLSLVGGAVGLYYGSRFGRQLMG